MPHDVPICEPKCDTSAAGQGGEIVGLLLAERHEHLALLHHTWQTRVVMYSLHPSASSWVVHAGVATAKQVGRIPGSRSACPLPSLFRRIMAYSEAAAQSMSLDEFEERGRQLKSTQPV